jgi:hypothetical protein
VLNDKYYVTTKMSHLDDIERTQIIMERERDRKKITTIATSHHCSTNAMKKILSCYYNTGGITGEQLTEMQERANQ